MTKISTLKWKWYGNAGHFICGQYCRFHLATEIGPYLISTVGEYVHPRHSQGSEKNESIWLKKNWPGEDIGYGRKYETMVFRIGRHCNDPECNCGFPIITPIELDFKGYNTAKDATNGHMLLCHKWSNPAKE